MRQIGVEGPRFPWADVADAIAEAELVDVAPVVEAEVVDGANGRVQWLGWDWHQLDGRWKENWKKESKEGGRLERNLSSPPKKVE